jgi:glycosyltransferase involved in cell wall biosynthesis
MPNLEFIEDQNTGILVEPENPEELAKAIIKLQKNEKLREEMGKNGREYVVKDHSWEAVARRVAVVCESAIREHKNKRR